MYHFIVKVKLLRSKRYDTYNNAQKDNDNIKIIMVITLSRYLYRNETKMNKIKIITVLLMIMIRYSGHNKKIIMI